MFLKTLIIKGFKSFADETRIDFADGITSLLGPNGCGKSNIVDSIKWVLGEQSVKSLRAGKREDVIFNGTDSRKPLQMAEVTLTINNEEGHLGLDVSEIEIKRVLFRTGESQYFINRQPALLKNVKELFMDTGVGKTAYSILEQGKIDQILSNKPEERRYVFDEAAGISKFKVQCSEAQKKIEKTEQNISDVQIRLDEVTKQYEKAERQMSKFMQYKDIIKVKENAEVELQLSTLQAYKKLLNQNKIECDQLKIDLQALDSTLSLHNVQIKEQQQFLAQLREQRSEINSEIGMFKERIVGYENSISILKDNYYQNKQRHKDAQERAQRFKTNLESQKESYDLQRGLLEQCQEKITDLENQVLALTDKIFETETNLQNVKDEIISKQDTINSLIEERNEITSEISELANEIVSQLQSLIEGSGYSVVTRKENEKAVITKLSSISKKIRENIDILPSLLEDEQSAEELFESLLEDADDTKGLFQEYCGTIPVFIDELIKPEGIISKKKVLDSRLTMNLTLEANANSEIVVLEQKRDNFELLLEDYKMDSQAKKIDLGAEKSNKTGLKAQLETLSSQLQQKESDYEDALKQIAYAEDEINLTVEKINLNEASINDTRLLIEEKINERDEVAQRIDSYSEDLEGKYGDISKMVNEQNEKNTLLAKTEANIINLNEMIDKVYSDFFDTYSKSLREFDNHEVTEDVKVLRETLADAKKRISEIGYVNQMADEEYNETKEQYEFLTTQIADLNKAKDDLNTVYLEIKTQSENMFNDAFYKISESFKQMFTRIFCGGKAELNLVDPENPLESGIEILAQPPGKKLTYLPLLSGGESSMTAVALLFATYQVKPSPFCILDEIDAALDARNIGAFLSVLDDFATKSQFIIITHNKHTVLGSQTLLGVTQEEKGVSKMITYKLETEKNNQGLSLK